MSEVLPLTRSEHLVAARESRNKEGRFIGAGLLAAIVGGASYKYGIDNNSIVPITMGSFSVVAAGGAALRSRIHAGEANYHELAAANLVAQDE